MVARWNTPNEWIPWRSLEGTPERRIFCFAHAGGTAAVFRSWIQTAPSWLELCPIELPGHGTRRREKPIRSLPALIQTLADALMPDFDLPFAFFGHSMGALICFELARFCRRRYSLSPYHLFVAAAAAPHRFSVGTRFLDSADGALIAQLDELGGIPPEVMSSPDILNLTIATVMSDLSMCNTYAYSEEPALDCPITVFGGLRDALVPNAELLGWRTHGRSFSLRMFPGAHFFVQKAYLAILNEMVAHIPQS